MIQKSEKIILFIILAILIFGLITFFDKFLAAGLLFIIFVSLITIYFLKKSKTEGKFLVWLFLIVLLFHVGTVLFVHYAHFNPFAGGLSDAMEYQPQAEEIARRIHQGNFSLKGVEGVVAIILYHTIAVGYIYAFTLPGMLIGQLFNAWIVALSIVFVYLIVREIGGSKKWAFLIGLIVNVYPSYLFYGSLLLKDCFVVLFSLASLLFLVKIIKNFSWKKFFVFYLLLGALINSRFYIGYIMITAFIICWFFLSEVRIKKRIISGLFMIFLLGFSPQIFFDVGYFGIDSFKFLFNPQTIIYYREVAFAPPTPPPPSSTPSSTSPSTPSSTSPSTPSSTSPSTPSSTPPSAPSSTSPSTPSAPSSAPSSTPPPSGADSSVVIKTEFDKPVKFVLNYLTAFTYVILGPFPWQLRYARQFFALVETIPWYILLFFITKGLVVSFKRNRAAIPLIVFSFGIFLALGLYFCNFGEALRIRMPAFISLLCLMPLGFMAFQDKNKNKIKKIKVCQVSVNSASIRFLLLSQIKFLQKEGYEVSIVCSAGKWISDVEKENIKVKTIQFKRKIFTPISDLFALLKLFFYFKKEKFDIVHTHTPKAGFLGQLAAKAAGVPIIIHTNHGFYFQKTDTWFKRKFFILIEKIAAECSDLIFSVNKEDIEIAVAEKICPASQIKYLGEWVDLERFNPYKFSENFIIQKKKELGINLNSRVIGIVARLVKEKGYLDLFQAFKKIHERFPNALLLMAGAKEPEKKDKIDPDIVKNYNIEKNVLFLGERTDIDEIFILMDIFVLPSYREGMGLSILEASAMEKPVVSTNVRGCREAVDSEKTGILVPAKDSQQLARALIHLLQNPERGKAMGKKGRIKVANEFDEKLVFERIKKEYQRLINEKLK